MIKLKEEDCLHLQVYDSARCVLKRMDWAQYEAWLLKTSSLHHPDNISTHHHATTKSNTTLRCSSHLISIWPQLTPGWGLDKGTYSVDNPDLCVVDLFLCKPMYLENEKLYSPRCGEIVSCVEFCRDVGRRCLQRSRSLKMNGISHGSDVKRTTRHYRSCSWSKDYLLLYLITWS